VLNATLQKVSRKYGSSTGVISNRSKTIESAIMENDGYNDNAFILLGGGINPSAGHRFSKSNP
jgi:hypothetical protein